MPSTTPGSDSGRYIVRCDDAAHFSTFLANVNADPRMELLDTIGPTGHPHTAVVTMPHDAARTLQESNSKLIIEPDRPLSLFNEELAKSLLTEGKQMPKIPESGGTSAPDNQPQNGASSPAGAGKRAASAPGDNAASTPNTVNAQPQASGAAGSGGSTAAGAQPSAGRPIGERKGQFLIAPRKSQQMQLMGIAPLSFGYVEQTLRSTPDIEVVDTVGPKNIMGALADGFSDVPSVLVAKMSEQKAAMLHQQAQGRLIVERDHPLELFDPAFQPPPLVAGALPLTGPVLSTVIIVLGKDNVPLKDAEVYLFGSFMPATGVTDERGQVTLSLFGETAQSIRSLYVKPRCDYWSFYQEHPDIATDEANIVAVRAIADWPPLANFPRQQVYTWGQRAMRLDQLPGEYRGQGIKVAVIDSGIANSHDDLNKVRFGFDIINKKDSPNTWNVDTISHGTHCAGVIAGADNAIGIRGFAPDAEVHACKLFPGGQTSQLIDALEYCIEHQIDVVNMSLGGAAPSEALEQQILRAKRAGVACIVAAGNSGGAVQYPASSPNVLAVAAIGKMNEFPPDSYHTQTLTQTVDANGYFSAKFSCFGPEVAVCAPGVAITSSVPANNFAVWDGTSMATPHITGLAALVLAHHPDFQGAYKMRSADRVERLFQIIKASARRLGFADPARTGYGLPDVLAAVGLQPQAGLQAGANNYANAQTSSLGTAIGGMFGNAAPMQQVQPMQPMQQNAFAPQGMNPYAALYPDASQQLAQQAWLNANGWMQPMQSGYMSPQLAQLQPGAQRFGFGMPSAFGGW